MIVDRLEGKAARAVNEEPAGCSIVAFDGAVRSSKSVSSLLRWVEYVIHGPKGNLLMAGKTETAVVNNLVMPLQQMLGARRVVLNRGLGQVTIMGRVVLIAGANDEQARTKIQGLTLAGAYLDEAANVPESFFNMLRSRLSVVGAMLFLTTNPEGPKHWLLEKWLSRARWWIRADGTLRVAEVASQDADGSDLDAKGRAILEIFRVTFVLDDNLHLARSNPRFVAELKASWPRGSMWHRRYILSEWASADGAVYPNWDEATMTIAADELPPIERVLMAGLDYGTIHPTRAYLLGLTHVPFTPGGRPVWKGATGVAGPTTRAVLIVLHEFAPPQTTVGEHATLFLEWLANCAQTWGMPQWIAIDHAAATFREELRSRGTRNVMGAHKAVLAGIQTTLAVLTAGRLYVVRDNCPHLVERIPGYMWDAKAKDKGRTEVAKVDDDEVDALRYAVHTSRQQWRRAIPLAMVSTSNDDDDE